MALTQLRHDWRAKHVECEDKPIAVFQCECDELKHFHINLTSVTNNNNSNNNNNNNNNNKRRGFNLPVNYTDRATAACRQS
jgi:hypothetical protein